MKNGNVKHPGFVAWPTDRAIDVDARAFGAVRVMVSLYKTELPAGVTIIEKP